MQPTRALFATLAAALCVLIVMAVPRTARAHVIGVSRGEYTPEGTRVRAEITMRADDASLAAAGLDADRDGHVSAAEVATARAALAAAFVDTLTVEADGQPCRGTLDDAAPDPPDGLRLGVTYVCSHAPSRLHLAFGFLGRMPAEHRHLATVRLPQGDVDTLAVLAHPTLDVDVGGASRSGFASLLRAGIEHILTGADHLAFLLALVLGGTLVDSKRLRVGALLAVLTAFTVGHSASLAIATLGGFAPGPRLVEPAVALSVAYVGAENLFARSVRHRWMLTLPFGFVHGFAFAGGLLPLGLPRAQLPLALFGFNLGVELGQLLVLGLVLPPLVLLRSRAPYPRVARLLSAGIAVAGVLWFVQRVVQAV